MKTLRWILVLAILPTLLGLACFGRALVRDEQFADRDAGPYYYPLYHRVQAEWDAGRWPLWEPEENAGMPLLGNPTAAVLYPPRVAIFSLLPYSHAVRAYAIAHVGLAFVAMFALLRGWDVGRAGATVGGLSYAYGAPVLSLYANIIFLVGAAWVPLGFLAADRWLRLGRRPGLLGLAAVLAMQVLGGDPESAYVLGLCAGGYAVGLAFRRRSERPRSRLAWPALAILAVAWVAGTFELARHFPIGVRVLQGLSPARFAPIAWLVAGLGLWLISRRGRGQPLLPGLRGLAASGALAGALAAVQILPAMEYTRLSDRVAEVGIVHPVYMYSQEPASLPGLLWPNVSGTIASGNRRWLDSLFKINTNHHQWFASLYPGGLALVMGLSALGFRGGPAWRGWMTAIAVAGVLAGLGRFAGPLWWARCVPSLAAVVGPHDPLESMAVRHDGRLPDAFGSPYYMMENLLPGFRQFRFPAKLMTFAMAALAACAGMGYERVASGSSRRAAWLAGGFLTITAVVAVIVEARHSAILAGLRGLIARPTAQGPLDPAGALRDIRLSLLQAGCSLVVALGLVRACRRKPGWVAAIAPVVLAIDLALANSPLILSVPQATFEAKSEAVRAIEEAERRDPSPGPFRVQTMQYWTPRAWRTVPSADRQAEVARWEQDTIKPKYGLLWGIESTQSFGAASLYEYLWFFTGFSRTLDARGAETLAARLRDKAYILPRRAFDMWNTRYFVVPIWPNGWTDPDRGYASLVERSERIYPPPEMFAGPGGDRRKQDFMDRVDFQVFRNQAAYPRAWVVHDGRFVRPLDGMKSPDSFDQLLEMLYEADTFWRIPGKKVEDPHRVARLDEADRRDLTPFLPGSLPLPSEGPTIVARDPQRVEIEVTLKTPGLVVLGDIFYPGWDLTIDGLPAPIRRANYLMRGAAVPAGHHRLVYTYRPLSVRVGALISLAGLLTLAAWTLKLVVSKDTSRGRDGFPPPEPGQDGGNNGFVS